MSREVRWRFGQDPAPLRERLERGGILAFPTESSYGLGVDPQSATGVGLIYELKRRERDKPLPVVIANPAQLSLLGVDPAHPAVAALARVWPAPLTCSLPTALDLPAAAGTGSLAVRVPAHRDLIGLLEVVGPLTATSANPSGEEPLLDPEAVAAWLAGWDAIVIDGPRLPGGPPSTLVRPAGAAFEVLRPGRFPVSDLPAIEVQP
ncbi:MAG TPA: L-threonylcarbamoyladenylate synthase [Thermoanaerobaculia bacterium]|nr:L-threonylcarbamoyladenylate synthase [Thermoanaerobaculia bacterium]